jgi:hypothetical protein
MPMNLSSHLLRRPNGKRRIASTDFSGKRYA